MSGLVQCLHGTVLPAAITDYYHTMLLEMRNEHRRIVCPCPNLGCIIEHDIAVNAPVSVDKMGIFMIVFDEEAHRLRTVRCAVENVMML